MTDVTEITAPATLRGAYLASRPTHSFNDIPDRRERLDAMQQLVDSKFSQLADPHSWALFADGLSRFPHLSPANVLLVLDQHPTATRLDTHRGWLAHERVPIERGIAVLIPSVRYKRVDGKTVWDGGRPVMEEVRQRPATLFDYTSTAGAVTPAPWEERQDMPREGFLDDLRAAAAAIGYSVENRRDAAPRERRVFALIHGHDDRTKVLSLAHDLGTAASGIEGADLFAYALCMSNGMSVPALPVPADPQRTVTSARTGLRRVLQRTRFRNQR